MLILKLYENYNDLADNKPSCTFNDITDVKDSRVGGWNFTRGGDLELVLPATTIFSLEGNNA